jgi:NAD+ synthase (glutamine-hydrolysing)
MSKKLRIALAQLDFFVGDIAGNLAKHIEAATTARDELNANVIVFPELSMTGYPPEDLLLRQSFIEESNRAVLEFQNTVKNIHCVVGHPYATADGLFNTASVLFNGRLLARFSKQHLPNYGVFDEKRYFESGVSSGIVMINEVPVAVCICEDLWFEGPAQQAASQGAKIILSPNASPFEIDKQEKRVKEISQRARANNVGIVYVNTVGGQDDLIFDGGSMVLDTKGQVALQVDFFQEKIAVVEFEFFNSDLQVQRAAFTLPSLEEKIYAALVMGVRDYVKKNNFPGALLGLSGGIDSALVLAIAVDALGKDRVRAVMMPSRYTADISLEDAELIAKNFGVRYENISIENVYTSFLESLAPTMHNTIPGVTDQNIQARCRGVMIMALSNASGEIVLTTGNRSEMAVGYATLYGDMAGGFAVLKDIPKTLVYRLAKHRNEIAKLIPTRIIEREPTAELAYDQKDEDTLPPYPMLDSILALYLNQEWGIEEIVAHGYDEDIVKKIINFVNRNEYKRRQSAVGTRINHNAFGRDRRYPVSSGFKG